MLETFLKRRQQRVKVNSHLSDWHWFIQALFDLHLPAVKTWVLKLNLLKQKSQSLLLFSYRVCLFVAAKIIIKILQLRAKFQTTMVLCSRFIWIADVSDHRRVSHGLGNDFVYNRFAVQTLLWSLEFVIQINLEHDTIAARIIFLKHQS